MSQTHDQIGTEYSGEALRRARARGARKMVLQGLTLYYQSLVHRVHEETPAFVDRVLQQTGARDRCKSGSDPRH
jgi:hypothetical protein